MSRPTFTLAPSEHPTVKLAVPSGWTASFVAVTRRHYNQLVVVVCESKGSHGPPKHKTSLLVNKWDTPYEAMLPVDLDNPSPSAEAPRMKFRVPEDDSDSDAHNGALELTFRTYHSTVRSVHGIALRQDRYSSEQVIVRTSENATKVPDNCATFRISVYDSGSSPPASSQYADLVITVTCIKNGIAASPDYPLEDIQGDIVPGFPKTLKYYYYFRSNSPDDFWSTFKTFIMPKITSALDLTSQLPPPADFLFLNVGFTAGTPTTTTLWPDAKHDLKDDSFYNGQEIDSQYLGDDGEGSGSGWKPKWDKSLLGVNGIFVISAFTPDIADKFVTDMEAAFSVTKSLTRAALYKCNEDDGVDHFGYRTGISNIEVDGATFGSNIPAQPEIKYPGSPVVTLDKIVIRLGDRGPYPWWAKRSAFMVTRVLDALVPEFEAFLLEQGPKKFPKIPPQDAADRLGARMFGRWKDGTPTELSPDSPDPSISDVNAKVNNFVYDLSMGQSHCPFAAHIRKSNPRNDAKEPVDKHAIRRQGRSYGPEVSDLERKTGTTLVSRGTHFVCYSTSIVNGFRYYQLGCNDPMFPTGKGVQPGFDPIVGQVDHEQAEKGVERFMTGANPSKPLDIMLLPTQFVLPRGGGYFYLPSLSSLSWCSGRFS